MSNFPAPIVRQIRYRDQGCLGPRAGFPGRCGGGLETDHIRGSGGLQMKSPSVRTNGATLCAVHHRWKTDHGRTARPALIALVESLETGGLDGSFKHGLDEADSESDA